jgi:hypothetical protein
MKVDTRDYDYDAQPRARELWVGLQEFDFDLGGKQCDSKQPQIIEEEETHVVSRDVSRNTTMLSEHSHTHGGSDGSQAGWRVSRIGSEDTMLPLEGIDNRTKWRNEETFRVD